MTNNLKRTYEAMFLVDSAEATANWDNIIAAVNKVLERGEAEVISLQKWDEYRLAYEVASHKRGTYILCYFKSSPSVLTGIERDVQLNELLLRVLILQADHVTEEAMQGPTPIMMREQAEHKAAEAAERRAAETAERKATEAAERKAAADGADEDSKAETAVAVAEPTETEKPEELPKDQPSESEPSATETPDKSAEAPSDKTEG